MEVSEPQKSINDVVSSVKSEGLFDQFRKECLEEFDNMENYRQLKQQVENHVASFLSKHKYDVSLQKNMLRNELRNHITKSEIILNSVKHLVDEVLSAKGHSFCLIIDKQVDKYLNKDKESETSDDVIFKEGTEATDDVIFKEGTEVTEIEEVQMELDDKVEIEGDVNNVTNNEKVNGCTEENKQINGSSEEGKHREKFINHIKSSTTMQIATITLDNTKNTLDSFKANSQTEADILVENAKFSVTANSIENKTLDMSIKTIKEKEKGLRRRSSRTRIVPLKYRDDGESDSGNEGRKKHKRSRNKMLDDTESISSNDVDDIQDRIVITIKSKKHDNDTDSVSKNHDNDTDSVSSDDADTNSRVHKKLIIKIADDSLQKKIEPLNKNSNDRDLNDSSKFFDEGSKIKRGRPPKRNSTGEHRKRKHSSVTNENESDDESIVSKRGRRSFRRQCYSPS